MKFAIYLIYKLGFIITKFCMHVLVPLTCTVTWDQKKSSDALELELQKVLTSNVDAGRRTQVF